MFLLCMHTPSFLRLDCVVTLQTLTPFEKRISQD